MKKVIIVFIVNIVFIVGLFLIAENCAYKSALNNKKQHSKSFPVEEEKMQPFWKVKMIDFEEEYNQRNKHYFRSPVGKEYNKKPILLFGCSFTYGYRLNDNETIDYYLSEYTKRPVYNRAHVAWGLQHMYYQLSREDFYFNIPEPEWLIYIYTNHHIHQFYDYCFQPWDNTIYLGYKIRDNKLVKIKNPPKFIQSSYLLKAIHHKIAKNRYEWNFNEHDEKLALQYFLSSKEKAQEHWKNTKFAVLFLDVQKEIPDLEIQLEKDLKANGFTVLHSREIAEENLDNPKYFVTKDDPHPNANWWKYFSPKLAKELKL